MKTKLFITFIFFLITNYSFSQSDEDFQLASVATDGTEYYVYVEKTAYDGTKEIWVRSTKAIKSIKNKKGKIVKTGGEKTLTFMKIDCTEREYDVIEIVIYNRQGNVISQDQDYDSSKKIVPGSVMSGIYDFVCSD